MSTIVLTAIIALSAQSCRSSKPLTTTTQRNDSTIIIEKMRDTTIIIPPDSAWLKAWLQCDSTGNILMQQLELKSSNFVMPMARLEYITPSGAILSLDCKTDSLEMVIRLKERTIRHLQQSQTTQYIEVERKLTWWQQTQIHLGRALLVLLAAAVVYAIVKLKH
ncbi:MAG: hypothetical protein MJ000_06590 [Bacteroidales bacterium]|nr:hypothetical protein [Bacteroidales bacterium]